MLIRVVEAGKSPAEGTPFKEIWMGGHQAPDERSLPSTALLDIFPHLEIGTWHDYDSFKDWLTVIDRQSAESLWTTIDLGQSGVDGEWQTIIEVRQEFALKSLCVEFAKHIERLHKDKNLWIRID